MRVPSGEISGQSPSAIFFECVPSTSATKIFPLRSYAILRCRLNERGKRDAKKDRNKELFHAFGALTLGKRAFLIRRLRFFPSVDIR